MMNWGDRPLKYPGDYEGFRYICRIHGWMSNTVPCPGPLASIGCESAVDRGPQ